MSTLQQVHAVNAPMTSLLTAYMNSPEGFIATKVFPIIQVQKFSGFYYEFDRGNLLRQYAKPRSPGGEVPRAKFDLSTSTYTVEQEAVGYPIPEELVKQQDEPLDLQMAAVEFIGHQLAMSREIKFATNFLKTSVWGTDYAGVASGPSGNQFIQWDSASSDPAQDVKLWKRTVQGETGIRPNTLSVTRDVHDTLTGNAAILDLLTGGATLDKPAVVTQQQLAAIFEVDNYYVMDGITEGANEGQTSAPGFIASKKALLTYTNKSSRPVMMAPSAGYHFVAPLKDGANAEGYLIRDWYDNNNGGVYQYDGFSFDDQKVVGTDLGVYAASVIA